MILIESPQQALPYGRFSMEIRDKFSLQCKLLDNILLFTTEIKEHVRQCMNGNANYDRPVIHTPRIY